MLPVSSSYCQNSVFEGMQHGNAVFARKRGIDYYPFGMLMPGRTYTAGTAQNYRYGFNGKEIDNEVYGNGNSYDFGARMYDPRVSRFLSLDPQMTNFAFYSPYIFSANNPVKFQDHEGESIIDDAKRFFGRTKNLLTKGTFKTNYEIQLVNQRNVHNTTLANLTSLNQFRADLAAVNPGISYIPKSELELKMAAHFIAPDPEMRQGEITQGQMDVFEFTESWLNESSSSGGEMLLRAGVNMAYSIPNDAYGLMTGRSMG